MEDDPEYQDDEYQDDEYQDESMPTEQTALMQSDRELLSSLDQGNDFIGRHILTVHGEDSWLWKLRKSIQNFFASKWGHYWILILVSLDISLIFADFLISLHVCEHTGEKGFDPDPWNTTDDVLADISFVFSWIFMVELIISIWAFGFSGYFNSKFRTFDAVVIVAGFIIDILTHGVIEEVGSLVVVGRLWRVFKIIEEFSSAGDDQMSELREKIDKLKYENEDLRRKVAQNGDDE